MDARIYNIAKMLYENHEELFSAPIIVPDVDIFLIIQNTLPEYRLYMFNQFYSLLNMKEYCFGLKTAYAKTSGINTHGSKVSLDDILKLFDKADKKELMGIDYKSWLKFPDEITIYRGTSSKEIHDAISWTIDRKRAIWFYKKYESKGTVLKAKVKKKDVLCYLNESACHEKEVIVNYKNIYSIEQLPKDEIDRKYNFDCYTKSGNVNNDYVIEATQYLLQHLLNAGVPFTKELAEEIFKSYQTRGEYKSKYILNFASGETITLYDLLLQIEKAQERL